MRLTSLAFLALQFTAQVINALQNLAVIDDNSMAQLDGVLKFPVNGNSDPSLVKRQIGSALTNQLTGGFYTIPVTIGTPGTKVDVIFDTGSEALWVNPVCSESRDPDFCATFDRFTNSSTIEYLKTKYKLRYGTGFAKVQYAKDNVTIGPVMLKNQTFGIAKDSKFLETGVMGTGPRTKKVSKSQPAYSIVDSLVEQGVTKSRAFGLDLQGVSSRRSSVVFGGVDTKRFTGTLERLPIIPARDAPDGISRYWVRLDSISLTNDGKTTPLVAKEQQVFLDSGAQVSFLPEKIVNKLLEVFPSAEKNKFGSYRVDCNLKQTFDTMDFKFGNKVIKIAYSDLIYQFPIDQEDYCILAFQKVAGDSPCLGASFLRSAYVVFDQDNKELSIAQSADCGTHLVAIGPGPAGPLVGECQLPVTANSTPTATNTGFISKPSSTEDATGFNTRNIPSLHHMLKAVLIALL